MFWKIKICHAEKHHFIFLSGEWIDGHPPILTPKELQIIDEKITKQHQNFFIQHYNQQIQ